MTPYSEVPIAELFGNQEKLYEAGARNFLFINLPPIDRAPACEHPSNGLLLATLPLEPNIKYANGILR